MLSCSALTRRMNLKSNRGSCGVKSQVTLWLTKVLKFSFLETDVLIPSKDPQKRHICLNSSVRCLHILPVLYISRQI